MAIRLYVGNLPSSADSEALAQLFGSFGDVIDAVVVIDRKRGRSKGFGFVEMSPEQAARQAIATLNGMLFAGRPLRVNRTQPHAVRATAHRHINSLDRRYSDERSELSGRRAPYTRRRTHRYQ